MISVKRVTDQSIRGYRLSLDIHAGSDSEIVGSLVLLSKDDQADQFLNFFFEQ